MKEVTYEEWQKNPIPREMWVWNNTLSEKNKRQVVCILKEGSLPVVAVDKYDMTVSNWKYCAEISKTRRYTNKELAWWLMDGIREGKHRECSFSFTLIAHSYFDYRTIDADKLVDKDILIREDGGEWREPLVEEI